MIKQFCMGLILFFYATFSFANNQAVLQTGQQWATALSERNPQKITALYDQNAYLYATFQNMLDNQADILNYFKKLMTHPNLKVDFINQQVRLYGETAINSGLYKFSYTEGNKTITVPARYTFVYTLTPKGWLIVEHHSSVLPDEK